MKTLITTIAFGLSMLILSAEQAGAKANHFSALNLKMFDNGKFSVVLDNQPFLQTAIFSVTQIKPGYHKLKVIRFVPCPNSYYPIQIVIYNGWISVPAKSVMYAQIDCHNQFDVVKIVPYFVPPSNGWGCANGWNNEDDFEYSYSTNYGYEGNGWEIPIAIVTAPPVPMCMSQIEFMQLKNSIANKSFEGSRLQIAKQALRYNYFSAAQIANLMSVFSFESTRLDFAKCAYAKAIDKENYYLVNDAFSFESSIQELNKYCAIGK